MRDWPAGAAKSRLQKSPPAVVTPTCTTLSLATAVELKASLAEVEYEYCWPKPMKSPPSLVIVNDADSAVAAPAAVAVKAPTPTARAEATVRRTIRVKVVVTGFVLAGFAGAGCSRQGVVDQTGQLLPNIHRMSFFDEVRRPPLVPGYWSHLLRAVKIGPLLQPRIVLRRHVQRARWFRTTGSGALSPAPGDDPGAAPADARWLCPDGGAGESALGGERLRPALLCGTLRGLEGGGG